MTWPGGWSTRPPINAYVPTSSHRERIARAMHENRVVILAGLTGSGKSTQVPQFLLEEKEEKEEEEEEDPIDSGGGGS